MPLDLNPIVLENGQSVPRSLDIESYFVRFEEGDGLSAKTSLDADFIFRVGKRQGGGWVDVESAGSVRLPDEILKAFPYYPQLVQYLGQHLYSAWLAQNPGYTAQP